MTALISILAIGGALALAYAGAKLLALLLAAVALLLFPAPIVAAVLVIGLACLVYVTTGD